MTKIIVTLLIYDFCFVTLLLCFLQDCLQTKDHLNFRYHIKRAMYLMFLASKLKDWPEVESVQFSRIQNQAYKPILILKPAGGHNSMLF